VEKRIYRVTDGTTVFDCSRLEGDRIEDDLRRRDFTINAMALDPVCGMVIDPTDGRKDLHEGLVRMVSAQVFEHDPVRLARAFRIAAVLDLRIEAGTEALIGQSAALIGRSAGERVRDELFKILAVKVSEKTIARMNRCGLLTEIFPEMAALAGCLQGVHHRYDALTHTLGVLSHLESVLADPTKWLPLGGLRALAEEACSNGVQLKLAALLHDIGKPACRKMEGDRTHFRGHALIGFHMAESIFARLRLSNRDRDLTGFLIRRHIEPLQLFIAHQRGTLTRKGRTRFFIRAGELTPPLVLLCLADMAGKKTPADRRFITFARFADRLLGDYFDSFRPMRDTPPLVNGKELMASFALSPSPLLGKILSEIEAERLEGRLNSKEDAMGRARELVLEWQNRDGPPKPK
jgi:putative nucleotidyltransferase with HDIG domain